MDQASRQLQYWHKKTLGHNQELKQQQNQSIKFNNVHINNSKKLAEEFKQQYTPDATDKSTKPFHNLLRNLRKRSEDPEIVITEDQVRTAIKKSKNSKALGPENISPVMLKPSYRQSGRL